MDLQEVLEEYIVGNFSQALNDAVSLPGSDVNASVLVFRSHIGLGQYDLVQTEIADSASIELRSVKLLSKYLSSAGNRASVLAALKTPEFANSSSTVVRTMAAIVLIHEEDYDAAIKFLGTRDTPEMVALLCEVYLRMNRTDLAEQLWKTMDEDSVLAQLIGAQVLLAKGGAQGARDAIQMYEELTQKHGQTVLLLNGIAQCHMACGKWADAERVLMDALNKRSSDPETLINLLVCAQYLQKSPELINRYVTLRH